MFQEYFSVLPSRLGLAGSQRAVKYIWPPVACSTDEGERNWWLTQVVPGAWSPYWGLGGQNRSDYVQKINSKKISKPVFAGILKIKKINDLNATVENSKTCEDLSFNPWNGDISHHKPMGVISRLKRRVYNASRRLRHTMNGVQDEERSSSK